jgi:lipopolysaccharide export system permease protein
MKIYSYILKAHIAPFIISFFIVIFVFTFQFIMKFIDNLIGKGLSWWIISQLIVLNLAWMVTLAVPMAVLIATLMAFGSLSSTNETTVMQTAGLSTAKLMIPVLIVSAFICYGLIIFNNDVLPEANHRTRVLMTDIQRTRPTFVIEPGQFTDDINGYNLLAKKTYPESNKLEGVFIIDNSNPTASNILTAERGEINFSSDYSKIVIDLHEGEIHHLGRKNAFDDYRKVKFTEHIVTIDAQGFGFSSSDESAFSRGDRELSADSMRQVVKKIRIDYQKDLGQSILGMQQLAKEFGSLKYDTVYSDSARKSANNIYVQSLMNKYRGFRSKIVSQKQAENNIQKQVDTYMVEIHKKYSIPFACVIFVLIGAPIGIVMRKGGFGIAAGMSLAFFLLYWIFLIGGEKLADRELLSPFLSMWAANVLLGIIGLYFTFRQSIHFKKIYNKVFRK